MNTKVVTRSGVPRSIDFSHRDPCSVWILDTKTGIATVKKKIDLEKISRDLHSAVIGDVMDSMGLHLQFLPPEIQPLDPAMVLVGYAMPVLEASCVGTTIHAEQREQPFGKMFEALDDLRAGEVYLCSGATGDFALWGELMTTRAMKLGAAGAVVDGYSRDTRGVLKLGFPTFSRGRYAQDQGVRGRVIDYRCPIKFSNGTHVDSGDLLFGDIDGVVVVPRKREREVLEAAMEKVRGENCVRDAIEQGMGASDAFRRFGIM